MMLWLLGLATAAFTLWVLWLLTDGVRAALARRAVEARKRTARQRRLYARRTDIRFAWAAKYRLT